jgi:threonine/homoserine/homoserine lactone efflux protein
MIEMSVILAWTALAIAVTITPGPDTILVISHTARGGLRAGLLANAGIQAGGLWYASLFGFGLLSLLIAVPALFVAAKIVGAIYLAWIGFGMLRRALLESKNPDTVAPKMALSSPFVQGLLTNVLNPKVALFYLAALPQFVPQSANGALIGSFLILIHYAIGSVWMSLIAILANRARTISWNRKLLRWIEGAIGGFFVAVAGRLAFSAR